MRPSHRGETWIRRYSREHGRLRLVCFPHAGGGASLFRMWPQHLPSEIDVYAVQLPGREDRISEQPHRQLPLLVQTLAEVLVPYTNLPFALFGHSLGALLAFEVARELRRCGQRQPGYLIVSGHRAPQVQGREADRRIHLLPDGTFLATLARLGGLPREVLQDIELMHLFLPLLRADVSLSENYAYTEDQPLDCPITALGGLEDESVGSEDLIAWGLHTRNAFRMHLFQGGHFFVNSDRAAVLRVVGEELLRMSVLCDRENMDCGYQQDVLGRGAS